MSEPIPFKLPLESINYEVNDSEGNEIAYLDTLEGASYVARAVNAFAAHGHVVTREPNPAVAALIAERDLLTRENAELRLELERYMQAYDIACKERLNLHAEIALRAEHLSPKATGPLPREWKGGDE